MKITEEMGKAISHTYIRTKNSPVNKNVHVPRDRKVLICMLSKVSGNVKDLLKLLSLTLEPQNYSNRNGEMKMTETDIGIPRKNV